MVSDAFGVFFFGEGGPGGGGETRPYVQLSEPSLPRHYLKVQGQNIGICGHRR